MKLQDYFPHYFPRKTEEIKSLFSQGVFVFDTNVYLDLYRLGPIARSEVLAALQQSLANRVWIPHHVAFEVSKNRTALMLESIETLELHQKNIQEGINSAKEILGDTKLLQAIEKTFLDSSITAIELEFAKILEKIRQKIEACEKPTSDDEVLSYLNKNIANWPIDSPSKEWYQEADAQAKDRYAKKMPPGYKDERKDEVIYGQNEVVISQKYGDYYIWKQLIEQVRKNPVDFSHIVFITSDRKEDWWEISRGKALGPRPELRIEISEAGAKNFHMYQLQRLVQILQESSAKTQTPTISPETLAEVQKVEAESDAPHVLTRESRPWEADLKKSFSEVRNFDFHPIEAELAVGKWLAQNFKNSKIAETKGFPDFIVYDVKHDESFFKGIEVITIDDPHEIRERIFSKINTAAAWIDHPRGLLSSNEHRSLTFVLVARGIKTSQFDFWHNLANAAQAEISLFFRANIIIGTIRNREFREFFSLK